MFSFGDHQNTPSLFYRISIAEIRKSQITVLIFYFIFIFYKVSKNIRSRLLVPVITVEIWETDTIYGPPHPENTSRLLHVYMVGPRQVRPQWANIISCWLSKYHFTCASWTPWGLSREAQDARPCYIRRSNCLTALIYLLTLFCSWVNKVSMRGYCCHFVIRCHGNSSTCAGLVGDFSVFLILTHFLKKNYFLTAGSNVAGNLEFAAIYNWGFVRLWVFSADLFLLPRYAHLPIWSLNLFTLISC